MGFGMEKIPISSGLIPYRRFEKYTPIPSTLIIT